MLKTLKEVAALVAIVAAIIAAGLGCYYLMVAYIAADWYWVQHSLVWSFEGAGFARFAILVGAGFAVLLSGVAAASAVD